MRATLAFLLAALAFIAPARAETLLRVGAGGAFTSLDPHYHNLNPNNTVSEYLFSSLVALDGAYRPTPGLAESWTLVGETTWEFRLRPGVLFHDGTPFTADDVAFTFERIPTVLNSPASFNFAVKPINRLEIIDPLTVRMHTAEPQPLLPVLLGSVRIVSRKHGEGAQTGDYNTGKAAIGTGPYKLESAALGDRLVFRRNEAWFGPRPAWDRVDYRVIANGASRTVALQAGDVDIIEQVGTRDVAGLRARPGIRIEAAPGQRLIYLFADASREVSPFVTDLSGQKLAANPLRDPRVRRALSLAINRDGIRTQIMDGFAAPTGQLMPEGAVGYDPTLKPDPFDLAQARKLLSEAGYPNGFALTLNGPNDRYVNDRSIVEAIAQMWTRAGVRTTVATAPASVFFSGAARDEYSMALTGWASDTGEASSSLVQIFASSNPAKGRGAVFRPSKYINPRVDELVERSLATLDPEAREALYQEATRVAMSETAYIPIHHQVNIWAVRPGYALRTRMQEGIRAIDVDPTP